MMKDNYLNNMNGGEKESKLVRECIWKEPITKMVDKEGGLSGFSLAVRECYACDGKQTLCKSYLEKSKKKINWLGLYENTLK